MTASKVKFFFSKDGENAAELEGRVNEYINKIPFTDIIEIKYYPESAYCAIIIRHKYYS